MTPLNHEMIKLSYTRVLKVEPTTADILAELTKGYPFAYQVLGYLCYGKEIHPADDTFMDILTEYDYYLQEFSYVKIWSEMSPMDRKVARVVAAGCHEAAKIQEQLGMDSKKYSVYRDRLKKKGLLDTRKYGEMHFSLPRFAEYINSKNCDD